MEQAPSSAERSPDCTVITRKITIPQQTFKQQYMAEHVQQEIEVITD
jgi:hypothetical protein